MAPVTGKIQRIAMAIEFDGRPFHGWQQQDNATSVQAALNNALQHIDRRLGATIAAGRTDAGVHAEALLVHADICAERWLRSPLAYVHGCNSFLPDAIRVTGVRAVDRAFHARFDCLERAYRYQIWNRTTASALQAWRHWWMPRPLNLELMREAAAYCLGRHDFSAMRSARCQAASAERTIREINIAQDGCCVRVEIAADAFLYRMVRNLVGNLVEAGTGKRRPADIAALLQSRDRSRGAATAPSCGLYFTDAVYHDFRASEIAGSM